MTQPEALRLADVLEHKAIHENGTMLEMSCAAELRRLHQFAEDQIGRATTAEAALQMTKVTHALKIAAVKAQRDALLEACKALLPVLDKAWNFDGDVFGRLHNDAVDADAQARAAIKQAEENT